jgi:hypothetical protein
VIILSRRSRGRISEMERESPILWRSTNQENIKKTAPCKRNNRPKRKNTGYC